MIVDCHSCGATYNISDEKIRGRKVRVRCKSCSEGIIVDGTRVDSDEATRVYSPTFEPAVYAKGVHDEATRVMAPSGPDLRVAASGEEWTVSAGESDQRTMDLAELISSYNGGLIPDDALVWREGMEDWQNIREVPEIQAAIESNEATHVVSPAIAVRAPRRAVGDRAVARRAEAEPARARLPSLVDVEPVAARARLPSIEGEPLPSRTHAPSMADAEPAVSRPRAPSMFDAEPAVSRPRAPSMFDAEPAPLSQPSRGRPPSAVTSDPPRARAPSLVDVNAPTRRAKSAPPPGDRTARVREGRTGGTDLFGNIEQAGGEEALLGSETLSQYDEKPIGARNESSVLFSLDALKAGTRRGSSAPPRYASNHPQTAADILGMSAGGALPGIGAGGSLLSAPAVDAAPMAAIPTTPPRSKMDTLPPMMRPRRSSALPIFAVAGAAIVVGIAFLAVRQRLAHQGPGPQVTAEQASPKAAEPTTTVAKAEEPPARTAADTQAVVPAETAPEPHSAAPSAPGATARASQGDGVTAPVLPQSKPSVTASNYEAAKAAMRVDKTDTAPKPAAEKSGDKATKAAEKVVLAEEGMDNTAGGSEAPAAPEAPPFDTAAAKAALAAAAAS
ncbi:MAG TPA: zinc-ribbon domain-containing protein, partial [Polyangiaceae bacterium]|nr:zinc-ribbon domain-containing protein [Polyangiaceae bacterium]